MKTICVLITHLPTESSWMSIKLPITDKEDIRRSVRNAVLNSTGFEIETLHGLMYLPPDVLKQCVVSVIEMENADDEI